MEFIPFTMAHTPLKITIEEAHAEVKYAWDNAYSPASIAHAVRSFERIPVCFRINLFIARLCFRGIYFPQMGPMAWVKLLVQNRRIIYELVKEGFETNWGENPRIPWHAPVAQSASHGIQA
jgi:hypothetical protein